ncbi:MAG: DUF559 domain-containing protein, partial [Croceibacterium sp.]
RARSSLASPGSDPAFHRRLCQPRAKLVVEVDGGQHSEQVDAARTAIIEAEGYQVLRFWNNDVLGNLDGCARILAAALAARTPPTNAD